MPTRNSLLKPQYCLCSLFKSTIVRPTFVPLRLVMTIVAAAMARFQCSRDPITFGSGVPRNLMQFFVGPAVLPTNVLLSTQNSSQKSYFFLLRLTSAVPNRLCKYRRYSLPPEDNTEIFRDFQVHHLRSLDVTHSKPTHTEFSTLISFTPVWLSHTSPQMSSPLSSSEFSRWPSDSSRSGSSTAFAI